MAWSVLQPIKPVLVHLDFKYIVAIVMLSKTICFLSSDRMTRIGLRNNVVAVRALLNSGSTTSSGTARCCETFKIRYVTLSSSSLYGDIMTMNKTGNSGSDSVLFEMFQRQLATMCQGIFGSEEERYRARDTIFNAAFNFTVLCWLLYATQDTGF